MVTIEPTQTNIFSLPNEILLDIFDLFPSQTLMQWTPTSRKLHTLILRLIHTRLQTAASLSGYKLYLQSYPPPKEWRAPRMYCVFTATDHTAELLDAIHDPDTYTGQVKGVFGLFSRYRPRAEVPRVRSTYNPITGARTLDFSAPVQVVDPLALPGETVTVDAHELFSQLTTNVHLGWAEPERGVLVGPHPISAGWIRIWRDWLVKHCERRTWADGEPVVVVQDGAAQRTDDVAAILDPKRDPCVLWLGDGNAGVRIRVREKQFRANANPYASDVEEPVSYLIEFEEVLVRTSHLLKMLEEAQKNLDSGSGKAVVFGSFRG